MSESRQHRSSRDRSAKGHEPVGLDDLTRQQTGNSVAEVGRRPGKPMRSKSRESDDSRVRRRRQQVVDAAVGLFSERGYYRTTVQEIANKAGVSAGLIYQYFTDKDDILLASVLDVIDRYRRDIPAALETVSDPLARFRTAVATYCRVVDGCREATVLAYRSTKSLSPAQRRQVTDAELETNKLIADCIQECVNVRLFRPLDVGFLTDQVVMLAHGWALKHWRLASRYTLEQYIETGLTFYQTACLTEAGWQRLHASEAAI
jgi:AcrR family transcriptional regulator